MKYNKNLNKSKSAKNDEFYTQMRDVENELQHYIELFKGKIVYCNCDSPNSNFVKYFIKNKDILEIKEFYHTWYNSETKEGDFRSDECVELLKKADIIVTNPPFSLFREYIDLLYKHKKKFLIMGSLNAMAYKEVFKLIKDNKMWLGINNDKGVKFVTPTNGLKSIPTSWFTNLKHNINPPIIKLTRKYNPDEYRKYDNCDAINVDKTLDIPIDYKGLMGVPISWLCKYNKEQFKIVRFLSGDDGKDLSINGKRLYMRILIKHI